MIALAPATRLPDRSLQPAAQLAAAGALAAAVPATIIAFVLYRALHGAASGGELVGAAAVLLIVLILRVSLGTAASRRVRRLLNAHAERLRVDTIEGLQRVPARRLREIDAGRAVAVLTTGLDEAVAVYAGAFEAIFGGLVTALLLLALLAWIDWRVSLVAAAFVPFTGAYLWQSRAISARAAPRLVRARSEGTSRFFEYVESVALLRTFGRTAERAQRLTWALQELKIKAFETSIAPIPFGVLALFFIEFGFAITVMVATEANVSASGFAIARFLLALLVALAYFAQLFEVADGYLRLRDTRSTWTDVDRLLERTAGLQSAAAAPQTFEVAVDRLSFGFDRGAVLNDISYRFPERSLTAIVGRSGAGKSALAGALAGVNEPHSGAVSIGGVDLRALSAYDRARTVSLVFQDTELGAGTIASNIAAGRPGASAAEIRAAARTAQCDEFIARLPDGFDTPVRAGAPTLSLGERQRIAIARALIGGAPVVVFDECTASLDPAAERAVHAAIEDLAQRATVILITHRLGTVRNAARIVVLADGRIVETGTHASLMGIGGEYTQLWSAYDAAHAWRVSAR